MSEVKKKVSWISNIVSAIVGAVLTVAGYFGYVTVEQKDAINAKTEITGEYAVYAAGCVDEVLPMLDKVKAEIPQEDLAKVKAAIQAKDYSGAVAALKAIDASKLKAEAKTVIDSVKTKLDKLKEIGALIKAEDYTGAKALMK